VAVTSATAATLLVTLDVRAGRGERLREELAVLAALSRADPGCVRYDVLEDVHERGRFVLWEEWLDEASWADHNAKDHVSRFVERSAGLLVAPMEVQRLRRSA
jgi:quinol monooxygenase YgiN